MRRAFRPKPQCWLLGKTPLTYTSVLRYVYKKLGFPKWTLQIELLIH